MKKKSFIGLFASLLGLSLTTTSCEDMLTPDMDLYTENFTGTDTVNFYNGILSNVQDVIENNILLGDIRSDLVDTTSYVSDTVASLSNFDQLPDGENGLLNRAAYYKVINQCNFYLAKADTMAQKNGNYYMRREFAQVQVIRAWTYMQLVQNYGRVPFITSPIDNAGTGWETNPEGGWATPENLLEKLLANGLERAYAYEAELGKPDYGSLNNGVSGVTWPYNMLTFPSELVLGDLYLLRGASQADYEKAATYYYNYLKEEARRRSRLFTLSNRCYVVKYSFSGEDRYSRDVYDGWINFMDRGATPTANSEIITMMLSAANRTFGTVLPRTAQIYGFDTSSSNSTSTNEDDSNETTTTGTVNVTANYKNRQIYASRRFTNLNLAQAYRYTTNASQDATDNVDLIVGITYPENVGDARYVGSVRNVQTDGGILPFVQKRCWGGANDVSSYGAGVNDFRFNYMFPVYRLRQVYLRYAEAVNRAGFPQHAFAILRDGLSSETLPTLADSVDTKANKVVYYSEHKENGCFIDADELRRAANVPFLSFPESDTYWENIAGVHEMGSGISCDIDTIYTYTNMVAQRIAEEQGRLNPGTDVVSLAKRYKAQLLADEGESTEGEGNEGEGGEEELPEPAPADDPQPANAEEINAVENLIADEMALETAFEGYRFYDLTRIARHKNNDAAYAPIGNYGSNWFAWTIARRSENLAPYEEPQQMNTALFNKLLDENNWYLQNPIY